MNEQVYRFTSGILLISAILLLLTSIALAQSSDGPSTLLGTGYDLSWWTVDGGGSGAVSSSPYTLDGTIGQPDAALWQGETYTLIGGFWVGAAVESRLYLPLVLRSS
jgi:hypothetical protein